MGWAFGSVGSTTILYVVNVMFLYFMVAHLGIAPAIAGSIMMFARIYDAIADLMIGYGSDRTKSRWGRRRPWMAAGTLFGAMGMAALFLPPLASASGAVTGQIVLVLVLLFTGYSTFSIPASAMATEMTTSYQGRTSLMAYRTFFIQVAGLVGASAAPAMVAWGGGTGNAYLAMGMVMAVVVFVSMGTAVLTTSSARETVRTDHGLPSSQQIVSLLGNRPFLVLLAVKFCGYIATAAMGAAGLFFMRDVVQRGEAGMSQYAFISAITGMACVPLWRFIARLGRKEHIATGAYLLLATTSLSWVVAGPAESDAIFWARAALTGIATTGGLLMALSMLPDTIEHDFHRTGLRREGVYAALFEFFQKGAFAVGPFIVGLFLSANGYRASTGTAIVQGRDAVDSVRLTMSVLPALAYGASIVLLLGFYRSPRSEA
ncbi:MFS transporter [Novosphingobium gossypii]|uniref:MFS transporter n=1 Tax=Novosphingobium gossypii TaxID=1604774 RepID=UPI003D2044AB